MKPKTHAEVTGEFQFELGRLRGRAEAFEEAAKIADEYDGEGLDSTGYDDQLGDGRLTANDIAKAIREYAAKTGGK